MKLLGKYLLLLSCVCFSAACDKEEENLIEGRCIPAWGFSVYVEDAETGADLLDPEVEGNIVSDRIRMDIDGKSYYVEEFIKNSLYDLIWDFYSPLGKYRLVAEGFPTNHTTSGVLDWGDGTQSTFVYLPSSDGNHSLWIDGVKGDRDVAIIRK